MKKLNSITIESLVTLSLLIFLAILVNPFKLVFPSFSLYIFTAIAIGWFIIFAFFLYKDNAQDEREQIHSKISGFNAYLIGVALLMVGIITEAFRTGRFDIWLALTLGAMVLIKFLSRIYSTYNQ